MIAKHWSNVAKRRLFWADFITPDTNAEQRLKGANRKTDPEFIRDVSCSLHSALSNRWPGQTVAKRIRLFAEEIGWSHSRARDIYYADMRVSLRAFEHDELNSWFEIQQKEQNA